MYLLGIIILIGFMALLGILIFIGIPEQNSELLYLAVGALITMAVGVVNYFYGSSKGSADKTEIMSKEKERSDKAEEVIESKR
jgi:drug/metabolite transporter (DMT)-like permease